MVGHGADADRVGSRTWAQRRDVHWGIAARYSALLVPTGFLGLAVLRPLPPDAAQAVIGLFMLVATWAPHWLWIGTHPEQLALNRRFLLLGGVDGLLNTVISATGPRIAPFFLNLGLDRRELMYRIALTAVALRLVLWDGAAALGIR